MLSMGRVVTSTSHLQQQASAVRKRVLTRALAGRMGFDSQDRRVQRAVTMWSAIAAGAYIGQLHMPSNYDPRQDDWLKSEWWRTYPRRSQKSWARPRGKRMTD
jgi:hypothetical protein